MRGIRGIDDSSYQSVASIKALLPEIAFGFVKATEGTGYVNKILEQQAGALIDGGKPLGFYCFLRHDASGVNQWDFFEPHVAAYPTALVCCDHERDEAGVVPDPSIARSFIARGKQRGYKVGRYGSSGATMSYSCGEDWRWVAQWTPFPPSIKYDIWQTSGSGNQDWDEFPGNEAQLKAFWAKNCRKQKAKPKPRWWLTDDVTKASRGPFFLSAGGLRIAQYRRKHPHSVKFTVEKR